MTPLFRNTVYVFIIATLSFGCSPKTGQQVADLRSKVTMDIMTLSSDDMEGREVGTEGERKAAEYIEKRYKAIGLAPSGDNGTYFQYVTRKMNRNPHGEDTGTGPDVQGKNIIGYVDNHADNTVIIGAHYDHLGYGKEGSLYSGGLAIHNGADDNSSGVAGVLYLAESIQHSNLKNNNYLYICFSGEEKGLWGSNYFVKHSTLKPTFNYMVNKDMIGRVAHWNDLYWPLIVITEPRLAPPPLGMLHFRDAESGANYGALMAGATIITAPLVVAFLVARRRFIQGITMTGIK